TISGTLFDASSRDLKENFVETDDSILDQVMDLSIYFYNYITDDDSIKHVGPTAEDFSATFNVGADNKHISPRDLAGVAIAAVQELYELIDMKSLEMRTMQTELIAQQDHIKDLEAQNADLEARLAALEAIVLEQAEATNGGD
ncbi:MAG: tail fiber domain-containing protein, partial [Chloroflexi bacterium]|nr:tail fiber domain-containing protein [Chloroflexota bacterium]